MVLWYGEHNLWYGEHNLWYVQNLTNLVNFLSNITMDAFLSKDVLKIILHYLPDIQSKIQTIGFGLEKKKVKHDLLHEMSQYTLQIEKSELFYLIELFFQHFGKKFNPLKFNCVNNCVNNCGSDNGCTKARSNVFENIEIPHILHVHNYTASLTFLPQIVCMNACKFENVVYVFSKNKMCNKKKQHFQNKLDKVFLEIY